LCISIYGSHVALSRHLPSLLFRFMFPLPLLVLLVLLTPAVVLSMAVAVLVPWYTVKISVYPRIFCGKLSAWAWSGLHYSVDLRIETYTEPVRSSMENSPKNIFLDIRIFLQCTLMLRACQRELCSTILGTLTGVHGYVITVWSYCFRISMGRRGKHVR